ncbi:hypothetical protein LJC12_00865 [Odoribacter sp. OttesenSCG-928-J03]|nr:hypothetical protein [Odoribacter sp. OttesenSCG-928-J03]
MKKSLILTFLFLIFIACNDGEIDGDSEKIIHDKHEFEIDSEGGELQIKVVNNFWYYSVERITLRDTIVLEKKANGNYNTSRDTIDLDNLKFWVEDNKLKLNFAPNILSINKEFSFTLQNGNSFDYLTVIQKAVNLQ